MLPASCHTTQLFSAHLLSHTSATHFPTDIDPVKPLFPSHPSILPLPSPFSHRLLFPYPPPAPSPSPSFCIYSITSPSLLGCLLPPPLPPSTLLLPFSPPLVSRKKYTRFPTNVSIQFPTTSLSHPPPYFLCILQLSPVSASTKSGKYISFTTLPFYLLLSNLRIFVSTPATPPVSISAPLHLLSLVLCSPSSLTASHPSSSAIKVSFPHPEPAHHINAPLTSYQCFRPQPHARPHSPSLNTVPKHNLPHSSRFGSHCFTTFPPTLHSPHRLSYRLHLPSSHYVTK